MNSVKVRKKFTVAVTATAENEADAMGHLMNELNRLNQPQPALVVPIDDQKYGAFIERRGHAS